jgi:hypothetical protein
VTPPRAGARRPWWLLLLPAAYGVHLAEEWWAGEGFAAWTERLAGAPVSTTRFLILNGVVWPLFATLTVLAIVRGRPAWFPTTFATVVLINAALHLLGSLATATYSPGLASALLLYAPVGGAALAHGRRVAPESVGRAVALGVAIHAAVVVIAFA